VKLATPVPPLRRHSNPVKLAVGPRHTIWFTEFTGTFFILPNDERRWLFVGAAGVMTGIGAWQIDKANRPDPARKDDRGAG